MIQGTFGTDAVFFTGLAGFERTQATQLAFYGDTAGVGHFNGATGNINVVFVVGGGFTVFTEGAVHHHGAEAQLDGALAHGGAGAVVLVHDHRDVREFLDGRQDQMAQKWRTGVLTGTGGGLDNHRRIGFVGGFHDGAHLFQVVDVKGWHTVTMLGGVIQHLPHRNQGHGSSPSFGLWG